MSQYSLIKLVIKIPKKKMGTAFAVPTIKIDGENYFQRNSMLTHIASRLY